jgi:hypothetical protein
VPEFRCFCLASDDKVVWETLVEAQNLDAAIVAAHVACQDHFKTTTSRVEVWLDGGKLYVSPPPDDSGPTWTPP